MVNFIRKARKKSLLALLKRGDKMTRSDWERLFEGVLFKDEYETFSAAGGISHDALAGLEDDDHIRYLDKDGTRALTGNWDVGAYDIRAADLTADSGGVYTDTITELTGDAGVTIETVLLKDYTVYAETAIVGEIFVDGIGELTEGEGVGIEGSVFLGNTLDVPGPIRTDTIDESTGDAGVTIEGVLIEDSNIAAVDYAFVTANDGATGVTAAELEELSDASTTTLHKHAYDQLVCFSSYIDLKERQAEWSLHGDFDLLDAGSPLDTGPTNIVVTAGIGKLLFVLNAGGDYTGEITVTGTTVDRDTGAETGADTDTITVDALTTDNSDTDAEGNVRHAMVGAYIMAKWFKGSVTLSTTNLTLTSVDTYQVAFEQVNDEPDIEMLTADLTAHATNANAWMYGYLYTLVVTGDKCDITLEGSLELPVADVSADVCYRIRRGNLGLAIDGTTDGFWAELFPGPLNQNYWENVNVKFWFRVGTTT